MTVIMQTVSAFCKAIRFGTNSPNTRLKNISSNVTPLLAITSAYGMPRVNSQALSAGAMRAAAEAEE